MISRSLCQSKGEINIGSYADPRGFHFGFKLGRAQLAMPGPLTGLLRTSK